MWDRQNPMFWSLSLTRIAGIDIRLSWMLPAVALLFWVQLGWEIGLTYFTFLFLAVLLHEFGHVIAARMTGGSADEIILSPIGGLAMAQPGPGLAAQLLTVGAGPFVNLILFALLFPGWYAPAEIWEALNLIRLPIGALHAERLSIDLMLLAFAVNWSLLAINLLPVLPFDGGQMTQAVLMHRYPPDMVFRGMLYFGYATAAALMLAGLILPWPGIIVLGALVLVVNVVQSMQGGASEYADDSFMGYDFSQGYTSLERSSGVSAEKEPRASSWQRWKAAKQAKREQQERERQEQDELQLDQLLAKVHEQGFNALTSAEKRLLQRVSSEYRDRSKRQSP